MTTLSVVLVTGCTTPLVFRPQASQSAPNMDTTVQTNSPQPPPSARQADDRPSTDDPSTDAARAKTDNDAAEKKQNRDVVEIESKALQEALIAISQLAIEQRATQAERDPSVADDERYNVKAALRSGDARLGRTSHAIYDTPPDVERTSTTRPAPSSGSSSGYSYPETEHAAFPETLNRASAVPGDSSLESYDAVGLGRDARPIPVNPTRNAPAGSEHLSSNSSPPSAIGRTNQLRSAASREAPGMPADSSESEEGVTENQRSESPETAQEAIDAAMELLSRKLKVPADEEQAPDRTREEVALRLLRMASLRESDRKAASEAIKHLGVEEAEFWQDVLFAIKEFQDESSGATRTQRATAALASLRRAEAALSNLGMLEVRNLKFCSSVRSFGRYEEFPESRFLPGQQVIIYAEVHNFMSEAKHGGYETALESKYEIYDAEGNQVDLRKFGVERELCASRRRDFYFPYKVTFPPNLRPGRYRLTLTIKDALASKFDQQSIDFIITTNE